MSAKVTTSLGETRREMWIGLKSLGWSRPAAAVISASSCRVARWKLATRCDLVGHDQRALARRVLGGDAGRAAVGVAGLRLDAADGEHEAARRVAPVGAERHDADDVEGGDDLAGGADLDAVARADADQGVVHEVQALAHRHADMIDEFQRRGAGAAFLAVDDDEVGLDAGLQHRLADGEELPLVADAELEAGRFAAGQARISAMKRIISIGVEKAEWRDGEMQSSPIGTPRVREISWLTLAAGSTPPWPGLAPWLSFSSIILTCGLVATAAKCSGEKLPSGLRRRNSPSRSPR